MLNPPKHQNTFNFIPIRGTLRSSANPVLAYLQKAIKVEAGILTEL
jgi:hypothetical protein